MTIHLYGGTFDPRTFPSDRTAVEAIVGWQQDAEREAVRQRWLEEQERLATKRSDDAAAAGNSAAAKKHLEQARNYNKAVSNSIDRQADIVPIPKSGGCSLWLLHVMLLPFHSVMAVLKYWRRH